MKTILLLTVIIVFTGFSENLLAQQQLPDTVWSKDINSYNGCPRSLKFSPDGKYLFAGFRKQGILQLDRQTGKIIRKIQAGGNISFSSTGDTVVFSGGNEIMIVRTKTGEIIDTIIMPVDKNSRYNCQAVIAPDGKRIITTVGALNLDKPQLLVYNIETKKIIKAFNGIYASMLKISPDGNYISFNSVKENYQTVRLIDLNTYEEVNFDNKTGGGNGGFSPDSKILLTGTQYGVDLWDVKTLKLIKTLKYYEGLNVADRGIGGGILFSNDSKYLIYGYFDYEDYNPNEVLVWNIEKDTLEYVYPFSASDAMDVSPDNYIAASGVVFMKGDFSFIY